MSESELIDLAPVLVAVLVVPVVMCVAVEVLVAFFVRITR